MSSLTWRTRAAGELAAVMVQLEACAAGERGEYGQWLMGEFFPRGFRVYQPVDRVNTWHHHIKPLLEGFERTGCGIGPFSKPGDPAIIRRELSGP